MQEQAAAHLLTAALTAAQVAGTKPKLLQQLSGASQIQLSDAHAMSDTVATARHIAALAEQLPWQLQQQPTEQLHDPTDEQAGAEDTARPIRLEPQPNSSLERADHASEAVSFAEQQLQQQGLGLVSITDATGSSSARDNESGMRQDARGEEEAAAKAAYRQWSEGFEADRVRGQYNIACALTCV